MSANITVTFLQNLIYENDKYGSLHIYDLYQRSINIKCYLVSKLFLMNELEHGVMNIFFLCW